MQEIAGIDDVSILSLRAEGDQKKYALHRRNWFQSSPSGRRETFNGRVCFEGDDVSILSLRAEGDRPGRSIAITPSMFQSSPSGRRETFFVRSREVSSWGFNPLPPGGGRHHVQYGYHNLRCFNPLPPGGGRQILKRLVGHLSLFQSSPSGRRETGLIVRDSGTGKFQSSPSGRRETFALMVPSIFT